MIHEATLVRLMRKDWKGAGYEVMHCGTAGSLLVIGEGWMIDCREEMFPRKALGLIAEHLGKLPEEGSAWKLRKEAAPQQLLPDVLRKQQEMLLQGAREGARPTRLTLDGLRVWHKAGRAFLMNEELTALLTIDTKLIRETEKGILASTGEVLAVIVKEDLKGHPGLELLQEWVE